MLRRVGITTGRWCSLILSLTYRCVALENQVLVIRSIQVAVGAAYVENLNSLFIRFQC